MDKNQVQLQYGVSAKNKQWGYVGAVSGNLVSLPIAYKTINMVSIISDTFGDVANSVMGSRPFELGKIQVSQFSNISGSVESIGFFYFLSMGI